MQAAPPPFVFDIAHADVILRSSDGKNFPMYKVDLARSSPIFESMFSLPQPEDNAQDELENGLPVVELTETANVLNVLLRFYMPRPTPVLADLAMTVRVLEGARKYEIDSAFSASCKALEKAVDSEPIRVYAIACHYGLEPLARKAALACLRLPLSRLIGVSTEEIECISGEEFRRLIKYREDCRDVVASLKCLAPPDRGVQYTPYVPAGRHNLWQCYCAPANRDGCRHVTPPKWWDDYRQDLARKLGDCTWEGEVRAQDAMDAFLASGACQACCKVASTQLAGAAAYIVSEISRGISQISLEFEMYSGMRSAIRVTGAGTLRRRMRRALKHVCLYGGVLTLGVLVGAALQWYRTPTAVSPVLLVQSAHPGEHSPGIWKRWFGRVFG